MRTGLKGWLQQKLHRPQRFRLAGLATLLLLCAAVLLPSCTQTKTHRPAVEKDKSRLPEYRDLGKRAIAMKNWEEASYLFGRILDLDPQDLEAHYYAGISSREIAKTRPPLQRQADWDNSKQHFQKVILRDSVYQDVLFQYALLLRARGEIKEAIAAGHEQIRMRPNLVEPQIGLFRIYRGFITQKDALAWLQQQPSDHARYFLGERLRRAGKLTEADSVFQSLLADTLAIPPQPIYLSLARVWYEKQKPGKAERYFWRAVDEIRGPLTAALVFEDVKTIVSDGELGEYRSLQSDSARIAFFHRLWTKRDPTPAARTNARLAEHYRRLIYAEKNYEYAGVRTCVSDPDTLNHLAFPSTYTLDHEFNDMGLIYLRHGPPDERVATDGPDLVANESWRYWDDGEFPELIFHFFVEEEDTAKNWRLGPILPDFEMVADRAGWGGVYLRLYEADELDEWIYLARMAKESQRAMRIGLTTDRHTWGEKMRPLEMPFSMASFRGKRGETQVDIYYALPGSTLAKEAVARNGEVRIEKGLAAHDSAWRPVVTMLDTISFRAPPDTSQSFVDAFRFSVRPDSYRVAFHARVVGTELLGGWKIEERFPDFSAPEPVLSDLVLADRIEPAADDGKFLRNGLRVVPNPTRRFQRDQPAFVYFEIYNLATDSAGRTVYTIEYALSLVKSKLRGLKKIISLFGAGGKSSSAATIERQGSGEFSAEYLALDLSGMRPGEYTLTVWVTDELTGEWFEVSTDVEVE